MKNLISSSFFLKMNHLIRIRNFSICPWFKSKSWDLKTICGCLIWLTWLESKWFSHKYKTCDLSQVLHIIRITIEKSYSFWITFCFIFIFKHFYFHNPKTLLSENYYTIIRHLSHHFIFIDHLHKNPLISTSTTTSHFP